MAGDLKTGTPFARPGTFAAGWNDVCMGEAAYSSYTEDYKLGRHEAFRLGAGASDAFNQITVPQ